MAVGAYEIALVDFFHQTIAVDGGSRCQQTNSIIYRRFGLSVVEVHDVRWVLYSAVHARSAFDPLQEKPSDVSSARLALLGVLSVLLTLLWTSFQVVLNILGMTCLAL
jgi:hypothetical protein